MRELQTTVPKTINIVSWNILLDQTRVNEGTVTPQSDRIASQIQTLKDLGAFGIQPDVVGICEAELSKEDGLHHGQFMAQAIAGQDGHWYMHNSSRRKHKREFVGLFGNFITDTEVLQLPSDKVAAITHVGKVAIAMNHFRNQHIGTDREEQAKALLKHLKREKHAVVMGDFNAMPHEKARILIRKAGFRSVFEALGQDVPATYPTDPYWNIFVSDPPAPRYQHGPVSLDDIYVRGMQVERAGVFEGASDHAGLWARISVAN